MSTYAYWRLWVGARMGYINMDQAPRSTDQILDQIYSGKPYEIDGLKIEAIYMHGEKVGLGVEVANMSWETEIGRENVFDFKKPIEAQSLIPRLEKVFGDLGMMAQILVMHHIDLGG